MFGNVQVFTVHADTQDSIVNSGGSSTEDSVSGIEEVQKQQQNEEQSSHSEIADNVPEDYIKWIIDENDILSIFDLMIDTWESGVFNNVLLDSIMSTDIQENENTYELKIELPSYKKENVCVELDSGYLIISVSQKENKDEKDEKGNYVCQACYGSSYRRSFYIGEYVKQEDIHAKFESQVLKLVIPKDRIKKGKEKKYIAIEG